jgi:predicted ribosome quality control (RQC) complex YloA/Tae2 family protein
MLNNYYTLRAIADSLDTKLSGARILKAYTQEKGECVLSFENRAESLVISCRSDYNTLYLHNRFFRARKNSTTVLAAVEGRRIESVVMLPSDRVVVFQLDGGMSTHVQCFGARSNVLLLDRHRVVVDAFKNAKALVGSTPDVTYVALVHDLSTLRSVFESDPRAAAGKLLKNMFPTFGKVLVREIVFRAGLHEETLAADVLAASFTLVHRSILEVIGDLSTPQPRVYLRSETPTGDNEVPEVFSIIPLKHLGHLRVQTFKDIHEAIRFHVVRSRSAASVTVESASLRSALLSRLSKAERAHHAVRENLESRDRAREYQRTARLILANLGLITPGTRSIDLEDEEGRLTIPLDSKLPPSHQARKYFEKAKKEVSARKQMQYRMNEYQASIDLIRQLLKQLQEPMTAEQLKEFTAGHREELERIGLGPKAEAQARLPFRTFTVDGGFEVWAGKNSKNNDVLTMKYARPNDLWFHARGAGGSHVVLKAGTGRGEPGKRAKEQAAAIAAYYSKMKTAGVVPVAMTERKYVRKARGAPPGQVIVEREKVIFAEPKLPSDHTPE